MGKAKPKDTGGVPRGNHDETEAGPPHTRPDEYGDANPFQTPVEKAEEARPGAPERETPDDRVEREQDR